MADIGNDKYLAYDLNGSGITGLIRLEGLGGVDVFNQLQTTEGIPVPLLAPTQNRSTTIGSIIKTAESISVGVVNLSNPSPFSTRQTIYKTDFGVISTEAIELTASEYRSEILFEMSAERRFSGSPLISTKSISLSSNGLESKINLHMKSFGDNSAKDIKITGGINVSADGDKSESFLSASLQANENFTVTEAVNLQGNGYKSIAKFLLRGTQATATINGDFQSDVSINSAGFFSETNFQANVTKFSVSGNLSSLATGAQSLSNVFVKFLELGSTIGGDVLVQASGEASEGKFGISARSTSATDRSFSIAGNFSAKASGGQSRVDAVVDVPNQGFKAFITVGGGLSTEASGRQSIALTQIAVLDGAISANHASVKALGIKSFADLSLVSGGTLTSIAGGRPTEGTGGGGGNISIDAALSLRSDAIDSAGSAAPWNAKATLVAYSGNVSIGSLDVVSSSGGAYLLMQGGFNSNFGDTLGSGSVIVNGATVIESAGASSKAEVELISNQQTISLNGPVRVIASGFSSSSTIRMQANSFEKPGYILPQTLIALQGDVELLASGSSASAFAVLEESGRNLGLTGSMKIIAAGNNARAESDIYAAGSDTFASSISLSGGLALTALGVGSTAMLTLNNNNLNIPSGSTANTVGQVLVGGPLSLVATGTHSVAQATIDNTGDNVSTSGVLLSSSITLKASGDGSASNLTLSSMTPTIFNDATRRLTISGVIDMQATGTDASATATLKPDSSHLSVGGVLISASGSGSQLNFMSNSAESFTSGNIEAIASGDTAQVHLEALARSSLGMRINGGINLISSGDSSFLEASLKSGAGLAVSKDVQLHSLGEGSEAKLTLSQSSGTSVSVAGDIGLIANSGEGSSAGAKVTGDFTLGKLGSSPIDLHLSAFQDGDLSSLSLKLLSDGGVAKLGGANQHGMTKITLGEKTATANQLLDEINIAFEGSSGKSIIQFGADQDIKTDAEIQRVLIKGFRLGHDELNFDGLANIATTARTLDGFISSAISHFNTSTPTGTVTPPLVADVLVGGNDQSTYLAYDHDGTGISAIIVLDGVSASQYKTANGMV